MATSLTSTIPKLILGAIGKPPSKNLFTTSTSNDTGSIIVLAADAEAVLTTRNDSATGDPHQFLLKHKGGSTILQNLRGDIEVSSSLHLSLIHI